MVGRLSPRSLFRRLVANCSLNHNPGQCYCVLRFVDSVGGAVMLTAPPSAICLVERRYGVVICQEGRIYRYDIVIAVTGHWIGHRCNLCSYRPGIYHGVWHYRANQLCSWRYFYDRDPFFHCYFWVVWGDNHLETSYRSNASGHNDCYLPGGNAPVCCIGSGN